MGEKQYFLQDNVSDDGCVGVEWQWVTGGTRIPISAQDLTKKSLIIVMARVYDSQQLFDIF